jgi:hypothetical protein
MARIRGRPRTLNAQDLKDYVVVPTLRSLHRYIAFTEDGVNMVLGTAAQESNMHYLDQTPPGPGPAFGIYQMERATHDDHYRWLMERGEFFELVRRYETLHLDNCTEMHGNLYYATIMCRIHYFRKPGTIPSSVEGKAHYWKQHYNTVEGKGKPEEFVANYHRFIERLR